MVMHVGFLWYVSVNIACLKYCFFLLIYIVLYSTIHSFTYSSLRSVAHACVTRLYDEGTKLNPRMGFRCQFSVPV